MSSEVIFLFDFGGSYTKAHIWELGTFKKQVVTPSTKVNHGPLGECEIDADDFRGELTKFFQMLIHEFGEPTQIAITGQMASFLIVDSQANPVTPIISWQDERSLATKNDEASLYEKNKIALSKLPTQNYDGIRAGLPLMYFSSILGRNYFPDASKILSVNQYAALILDKELKLEDIQIHESEAASTGLHDLSTGTWSLELLKIAGIGTDLLPSISNKFGFLGATEIGKYQTRIPLGDFQTAIEGVGLKPNQMFIHIATGGQVARYADEIVDPLATQENWIQCRPSLYDHRIIQAVTHLPAGRLLSSIAEILEKIEVSNSWERIDRYFGESSPLLFNIDIADRREFSISGIPSSGFEIESLIKGVLHGLLNTYRFVIDKMLAPQIEGMVFSGGALNKLPNLMEKLKRSDLELAFQSHDDIDTSLKGLAHLVGLSTFKS
jgi:xylulokinase